MGVQQPNDGSPGTEVESSHESTSAANSAYGLSGLPENSRSTTSKGHIHRGRVTKFASRQPNLQAGQQKAASLSRGAMNKQKAVEMISHLIQEQASRPNVTMTTTNIEIIHDIHAPIFHPRTGLAFGHPFHASELPTDTADAVAETPAVTASAAIGGLTGPLPGETGAAGAVGTLNDPSSNKDISVFIDPFLPRRDTRYFPPQDENERKIISDALKEARRVYVSVSSSIPPGTNKETSYLHQWLVLARAFEADGHGGLLPCLKGTFKPVAKWDLEDEGMWVGGQR
ncbi:MAG: hypothetical protein Q9201_001751 [Fulgogasparrea decipioides]